MKIRQSQLKKIIKEEMDAVMKEQEEPVWEGLFEDLLNYIRGEGIARRLLSRMADQEAIMVLKELKKEAKDSL